MGWYVKGLMYFHQSFWRIPFVMVMVDFLHILIFVSVLIYLQYISCSSVPIYRIAHLGHSLFRFLVSSCAGKVVNIRRLDEVINSINGWYMERGLFGLVSVLYVLLSCICSSVPREF